MAVTESKLKSLHGKKRNATIELSDRDGLVASIGKSGKISWVYRYRFNKQQKRIVIGYYPALNIVEARERLIPFAKVLIEGHDPKHLITSKKIVTLDDCAEQYTLYKLPSLRPNTQKLWLSNFSAHINNKKFPHDVQKARFEYWLSYFDNIAKQTSRVNAGAIYKSIRSLLNWCKSRNMIQSSIVFDIDLKAIGEPPKRGESNLTWEEIRLFWQLVNQSIGTPALKGCVKLLLIFGARNTEIREAHKSEFDLINDIWTLPAERSKTKKAIRRPIPALAKRIIEDLFETYPDNELLIPGQHRGLSMTTHAVARFVARTWMKMHKDHRTVKFTAHDFRRTLSTRLSELGVLPHVTEKMLGHELRGIMAVYNKHDWLDEQRAAYNLYCDNILKH